MSKFTLEIQGETRQFIATRQGDRLRLDDGEQVVELHLQAAANGVFLLEWELADGRRQRIRLAGHGDGSKRQLWVNGRYLQAQRLQPGARAGSDDPNALAPAIPAVVSELLVQPGDIVQAGQKCILLESMKMVIPIQAPYAGRVTAVHCRPGDSVPAGVPLLEIDPEKG